ncbi:MAG TPA: hypothetical protein VEC01_01005 [Noviherbaspirillum sp.]|uniref:hypothetical protein n=1 Tax=Noviherbaspirillum sp. TaxID=1926288 RepID=UPI002D645CBA|nr:hypothetical protein [Noviherbaspirillum sp.]HYD93872.1 hypothetical protein [Noviherbaspirillum sp.]
MASALSSLVLAASATVADLPPAEVERSYWDCEFTAIQGTIDLDAGAACSAIYEQLKADKFDGDFDRFLAWWRENKERELSARMGPGRPRRGQ